MTVMISSQQDSQISIQREILTQKQSFTYNFSLNNIKELFQIIDSYLHVPFGQLHIQMSHKDLYIRSQGKYNSISSPSLLYKYTAPSKRIGLTNPLMILKRYACKSLQCRNLT